MSQNCIIVFAVEGESKELEYECDAFMLLFGLISGMLEDCPCEADTRVTIPIPREICANNKTLVNCIDLVRESFNAKIISNTKEPEARICDQLIIEDQDVECADTYHSSDVRNVLDFYDGLLDFLGFIWPDGDRTSALDTYASLGKLAYLKYAYDVCRANNISTDEPVWNSSSCSKIVGSGSIECFIFAATHGCPIDKDICSLAIQYGNFELLLAAQTLGYKLDPQSSCRLAVASGKIGGLECLIYALQHGCQCDEMVSLAAFMCENRTMGSACLEYLIENGYPVHKNLTVGRDVVRILPSKYPATVRIHTFRNYQVVARIPTVEEVNSCLRHPCVVERIASTATCQDGRLLVNCFMRNQPDDVTRVTRSALPDLSPEYNNSIAYQWVTYDNEMTLRVVPIFTRETRY